MKGDSLQPCRRGDIIGCEPRDFDWISMAGLGRITEHVAKVSLLMDSDYPYLDRGLDRKSI